MEHYHIYGDVRFYGVDDADHGKSEARDGVTRRLTARSHTDAGAKPSARKPKKRVCAFPKDKVPYVDYKDTNTLRKFTSGRDEIRMGLAATVSPLNFREWPGHRRDSYTGSASAARCDALHISVTWRPDDQSHSTTYQCFGGVGHSNSP